VSGIFGGGFRATSGNVSASLETSTLEMSLRGALARDAKGQTFAAMRPRSYVAIVERPPLVSLGVDSAEEVASLHVVTGSW
jgi:hypothetical protein